MLRRTSLLSAVLLVIFAGSVWADDKVDFEKQIRPILVEACGKCHGAEKAAAKMRLNTAANIKEKWDADKELIVAGEPDKSELYKRLVLPKDDKKFMPKGGEPLPKDKLDLIAKWIKEGAVLPVAAAVAAADAAKPSAAEEPKKVEKPAEIPLPKVSPAPKEAIDKLTAAGAQVMPLYAESPLLIVSFAHRNEPAGDTEVALLAGVAEQCYGLNLSDSKASDAGLAPLEGLKNLAELHLERSTITDAGLAHVGKLANLQYLNLFGTGITDAGIENLKGLKNLRKLYLWQTKVNYDPAMALEKETPGLMVNLGYDHPVVMKMRLTKELESAKKQAEEAKASEAKAQQELDAAKKNAEAVNARVTDIEKQLKELGGEAKPEGEKKDGEKKEVDKPATEKAEADKKAAEKAEAEKKAAEEKAAADEKAAAEAKAKAEKDATEKKADEEKKEEK